MQRGFKEASGEISGNAASMVLELQYGELEVLFTGDVEGEGEDILTEDMKEDCTVLKVAHHGSRNSTSEAFLKKSEPRLAIISAGRENRYGHPHVETIERLTAEGCMYFEYGRMRCDYSQTDWKRGGKFADYPV